MTRKLKKTTLPGRVAHLATKRDVRELARKTEVGFEQLVVSLNAALKLMKRDVRRARRSRRKVGL